MHRRNLSKNLLWYTSVRKVLNEKKIEQKDELITDGCWYDSNEEELRFDKEDKKLKKRRKRRWRKQNISFLLSLLLLSTST
jgi:hypothetical protein